MKNNVESFIKYLDKNFSEQEQKEFETKLKSDQKLKSDFENFSKTFNSSKKEIEVNEDYFVNLIPNARRRIYQNNSFNVKQLVYIIPVIIFAAYFIIKFFPYSGKQNLNSGVHELSQNFSENGKITEELLTEVFDNYDSYNNSYDKFLKYYETDVELNETVYDYLEENVSPNEINETLFEKFSENEFNQVYNEILTKKIL
ncbi:MAG: hypothetical protein CR986_10290 [Ignavibacteriae bacterium]|nr:MAG: hypothetical protein CR986_10290 [Ignavibacteriota bacterium]